MDENELADMRARKQLILEIATALYDKSIAYTNLILVAGYAAFITVWSSSKDYLSSCQYRSSILLLLFSLLVFVLWEIAKMVMTGLLQQKQAAVVSASPESFWAEMAKLQQFEQSFLLRSMGAWPIVLAFTIVPGVLAIAILMWGLATHGRF